MLRYALLGRTGSGRRFFQQLLETNGFKVAKSYTTRECKDDNDNQHHFIENIHSYDNERVLETHHNGYAYFYTMKELENADIIPIDPENIKNLCNLFPNDIFRLIELVASNENRLTHAVTNEDDKITAEDDFISMCEEENAAFCELEDKIANGKFGGNNLLIGNVVNNDFTENADMFSWSEILKTSFREFERMKKIITELADADIICRKDDKYTIVMINENDDGTHDVEMSCEAFAENTLCDPDGVRITLQSWLRIEKNSFND